MGLQCVSPIDLTVKLRKMSKNYHGGWVYFSNPFYVQTQKNYKNFFALSSNHLASLEEAAKTSALIERLVDDYQPLHEAFSEVYVEWQSAKGLLKGLTAQVDKKQETLVKRIGKWDVRLQTVFYQDTPEYQALLPQKRKPFQSGSREQRLQALKVFAKNLARYPQLAALQKEVGSFYQAFVDLREQQQRQQTTITRTAEILKGCHQRAAVQMYRNLGMLIYIYDTGYELASFFKLSLIRKVSSNGDNETEEELAFPPSHEVFQMTDRVPQPVVPVEQEGDVFG